MGVGRLITETAGMHGLSRDNSHLGPVVAAEFPYVAACREIRSATYQQPDADPQGVRPLTPLPNLPQRPLLHPIHPKVPGTQPRLKRPLRAGPLSIQQRKPSRIPVPAQHDHVLAKHSLKREPESECRTL